MVLGNRKGVKMKLFRTARKRRQCDDAKCQLAAFAAGCFWGVQAAFDKIPGVVSTIVGYTGGQTKNPSYEQVCSGKTGHAEAVQLEFNPEKVSFEELLRVFWSIHNPTEKNRQGPDVGEQYRSAIFYHSEKQKQAALDSKRALEALGKYDKPIATKVVKAGPFFKAEERHQKHAEKHGKGVC